MIRGDPDILWLFFAFYLLGPWLTVCLNRQIWIKAEPIVPSID
jgi:hypothetical protein